MSKRAMLGQPQCYRQPQIRKTVLLNSYTNPIGGLKITNFPLNSFLN